MSAEHRQAVADSLLPRLIVVHQLLTWCYERADCVVDPVIDNVKHDIDAIGKDVRAAMKRLREERPA